MQSVGNDNNNTGKIVLVGGALAVGGYFLAKKLISATNLQSQVSFYLSSVTGNATLSQITSGRIEISTTLRIINGSSISIPFSINQAKIIYKGVEIAVSKPDAEITLEANSTINKKLTFEVPLLSLGLQSDVIADIAKAFLSVGGISAKISAIMASITPNISLSTTVSINGITANFVKTMETLPTTKGIGLSAGERNISDGSAFNKYFKKSTRTNVVLNRNGSIPDVISAMVRIVETHYHDTDEIAQVLKGANTLETSRNIWNFAVKYIRYHNDRYGVEELRTPLRSWNDGQIRYYQNGESEFGIDCDDFAMFCGSILKSLGIPFHFRITKYYYRTYFQHVYLYIPNGNNGGEDIIIDPVVDAFNYEKPYTQQEDDFNMASLDGSIGTLGGVSGMPIEILSGLSGVGEINGMPIEMLEGNDGESDLYHLINGTDLDGIDIDDEGLGDVKQVEDGIYNYLVRTRRVIASDPNAIKAYSSNPQLYLSMMDKAIDAYYTPQRDVVLKALSDYEDKLGNDGTIKGIDPQLGGFFKNIGKFIKKVGKAVVKVAKAVLVTFNPLFVLIRGGMILAMKVNLFWMASKFQYGYLTEAQAKANNLNMDNWRKAVRAKDLITSIFTKIGGKEENLREAILKGRSAEGMIKGLGEIGQLGFPAVILPAMTALAPPIAAASGISAGASALATGIAVASGVVAAGAKVVDIVKKGKDVKDAVVKVVEKPSSIVSSSVVSTATSLISPERKAEVNALLNNSGVQSIQDAKALVDGGLIKASELYNTMTPASRANLTPESSTMLTKMLVSEAFAKGASTAPSPTTATLKNGTLPQNNSTATAQNNKTTSEVSQSNNTTMADNTTATTATTAPQTFLQKNKKAIFIGIGVLALAGIATAVYATVSSNPKPQQIASRPRNNEATIEQGLSGFKRKRKAKNRRRLSGINI